MPWLNTSQALSITENLAGKIVVLDFWTYCCINCMHVLPDLEELEQKYSITDGVIVIGVHSAKFPNEKVQDNIKNAVERYGIHHPIVNDGEAVIWNKMNIQCWPTIVVVGPDGLVLNTFIGEGHKEEMITFIGCVLEVYKKEINYDALPFAIGPQTQYRTLSFPGKVLIVRDKLIISDTGNHRVLVCDNNGLIEFVIGSGKSGSEDGSINDCSLKSPQGLCLIEDTLYVADCDSHLIRKVNLSEQVVLTLAGTGNLGSDKIGGLAGVQQVLSSPWDIKAYSSHGDKDDMLLIAMAGTHQIWSYFLLDVTLWKKEYKSKTCHAVVGSGKEENKNNSYPLKSGLAQPSGLSINKKTNTCYIADSESSTVRQLNMNTGQVKALVGGARDPSDLFAYGDSDGKGIDVKLQHPLDVCVIPETDHAIICDSYNHKLKLVNTKTQVVSTLPIQGLNEPGGICYCEQSNMLYIADTNNHRIVRARLPADFTDIQQLVVEELSIKSKDQSDSPSKSLFDYSHKSVLRVEKPMINLNATETLITIDLYKLEDRCHITNDVESVWRATITGNTESEASVVKGLVESSVTNPSTIQAHIPLRGTEVRYASGAKLDISVEVLLYYCSDEDSVCKRQCILVSQQININ